MRSFKELGFPRWEPWKGLSNKAVKKAAARLGGGGDGGGGNGG